MARSRPGRPVGPGDPFRSEAAGVRGQALAAGPPAGSGRSGSRPFCSVWSRRPGGFTIPSCPASSPLRLPAGLLWFRRTPLPARPDLAALSWLTSSYRFTRYKASTAEAPRLVAPAGVEGARLERIARGLTLARNLVNTPANDLGPDALEAAALDVARRHGASARTVRGETLAAGLPADPCRRAGGASAAAPRGPRLGAGRRADA